jgi:hypothetical protein
MPKDSRAKTDNPPGRQDGPAVTMTKERRDTLINAVRMGNPLKTASEYSGISGETVRTWRAKGEMYRGIPEKDRTAGQQTYVQFASDLGKAMSEAFVQAQRTVHLLMRSPGKDERPMTMDEKRLALQAAEFFLKSRDVQNYGTSRQELTGADGTDLINSTADEAFERLQAILFSQRPPVSIDEDGAE